MPARFLFFTQISKAHRVTQFGKRSVYLGLEAELLSRGFFLEETPFGGYRINTEKIFDHMEKESSLI